MEVYDHFQSPVTSSPEEGGVSIHWLIGSQIRSWCVMYWCKESFVVPWNRLGEVTSAVFVRIYDRLYGLVVRVPGCRSRSPGFDSQRYQIFWEVVGLERGSLSLVSTIEELLERKSCCSGLENRDYGRKGSAALTVRNPSVRKSWH
jgi:hypothetical protein